MVLPVFIALALGTPVLGLMGGVSALGEWATEEVVRLRPHPPTLPGSRSRT